MLSYSCAQFIQLIPEIVRAFIALRRLSVRYSDIRDQLNELRTRIGEHDVQLSQIYESLENLLDENVEHKKWNKRARIGFKPD